MHLLFYYSCIRLRWVGVLVLVLSDLLPAGATHIVGGEMGYTCLGDDRYEIRLTIYRDCFYGNPNAYFDDPASIGVFDANNVLLQDIRVALMEDDTLSPVLSNECLVVPPDVCVHTTTHRTIVTLPARPGGYQLAYQRCCRNQTIANIIDPLSTGATFGVTISEAALLACNSGPEFLQWPPLYICANEPIFFDQSAMDADGDSIVYRLCTPLTGGTTANPRPQPPNNPPYAPVTWNSPPYGVDNMLNGFSGSAPLQINPVTGLLTGTPNTVGQFVVGICAEEYRNGVLISTLRRDFQYNVGVCGETNAAFLSPDVQCDGLEVTFSNQSLGSSRFLWQFGDPTAPLGTSELENPSFTFPDYGTYPIQLIAAVGEPCADTFATTVTLLPLTLQPLFQLDTVSCGDSLVLQLTDLSTDSLSEITSWEWRLDGVVFSNEPSPTLVINNEGNHVITLSVTAANSCENATAETLSNVTFIREQLPTDTLRICQGESALLNPAFLPQYQYLWSPAVGLSSTTAPNPVASPTESTQYRLQLTDPNSGCTADRYLFVAVSPQPQVALEVDTTLCSPIAQLTATASTQDVQISWSPFPDFSASVTQSDTLTLQPVGEVVYYLRAVNAVGCEYRDTIAVNSQAVNVALPQSEYALCLGESVTLVTQNLDAADVLTYTWQPSTPIISGATTATPTVRPTQAGEQWFTFTTTNQLGCSYTDSLLVTTVDGEQLGADLAYVQCSGYAVSFSTSDPAGNLYRWHFGDPAAPQASAVGGTVQHTYTQPGTYQVQVTLPSFLPCTDTFTLAVVVAEMGTVMPAFRWEYTDCTETATLLIVDETTTQGTTLTGRHWWIGGTAVAQTPTFEWVIPSDSTVLVQLITEAANGCVDTLALPIVVVFPPLPTLLSLVACSRDSVALNPGGNAAYRYLWSGVADSMAVNPMVLPEQSTTYSVTVSDPNSICVREGQVSVVVPPPFLYVLPADTVTCATTWLLTVASDVAVSYTWARDAAFENVIGQGAAQSVLLGNNTHYYVSMTDALGCTVVDSIAVESRRFEALLPPASSVCIGDTLVLTAATNPVQNAATYDWSPVGGILGSTTNAEVLVLPSGNAVYEVSVTNEFGCEAVAATAVSVLGGQPFVAVTPSVDTVALGQRVVLTATDNANYTYTWSPGEGLSSTTVSNPTAAPEETTRYTVTVTDANGCTNTASVLLVVFNSPCLPPYIFVPTAFTPNGDQLNDVLEVKGNAIEDFRLIIYNRWGEQVFESRSQADAWDGTYRGEALPPDVYGYYLEVGCYDGSRFSDKGNVTLLR